MSNNKKTKATSRESSQGIKRIWLLPFLLIIVGPLIVIVWICLTDQFDQITGQHTNLAGLTKQDWVLFWGAYMGGIATVIAVLWTVSQTERHYVQTSEEQKRQNLQLADEREKQRRLDVLPIILLQPRIVQQSNDLAVFLGNLEERPKEQFVNIDQIKPRYEEFDVSEISVLFTSEPQIYIREPSEEEMRRVKNKGNEIINLNNSTKTDHRKTITFLHPFWCINAGKEAATNITLCITKSGKQTSKYLTSPFSLMPKEKIKLNFLVDISVEEVNSLYGKYSFVIRYNDIYATKYNQKYGIDISDGHDGGTMWSITLGVEQRQEM